MPLTDCTARVENVEWEQTTMEPQQPTLIIYIGSVEIELDDWLTTADGDPLTGDDIDVSFRYRHPDGEESDDGVIGIAKALSGEYVLEATVTQDMMEALSRTGRQYVEVTGNSPMMIQLKSGSKNITEFEPDNFLVYESGEIQTKKSLIPGDVEM